MKLRKTLILLILLITVVGASISFVSAVKYNDWCNNTDKTHKTTWEKIPAGTEFKDIVKISGKYYKRYYNLCTRSIANCTHESHKATGDYPYSYSIWGRDTDKPYTYRLAKTKTTGNINFNKNSNNYGLKNLGKNDTIQVYYSYKGGRWDKNTMFINLGYKYPDEPGDNIARNHKLVKASVKFVKGKTSITKTFTPNRYGNITYKVKNGYTPQLTKITYAY